MSDSVTRQLLCPLNFPVKNTEVGFHSYSRDLINIIFSIFDDILLSTQSFLINLNIHLIIIPSNLSFLDKREFLRATEVISRTSFLSAF